MRAIRLNLVLALARLLAVPVHAGYSFFALGKNAKNSVPGELM